METELFRSSLDKRKYRLITLPNKLQCLLVCDESTKKSAASMMVKVGMLDDPIEAQGLAHFLEHMLFMGSEKYPGVNDFNSFVQTNSGETNASTSTDGTKYYFEIANQGFCQALDMWGQFFVAPLFSDNFVEREMNAVESEFQLGLSEDESRIWEYLIKNYILCRIFRKMSNKNSSFNKFGCGNLKTLNQPGIRDKLIQFYQRYYCASLMKLTIYSSNTFEQMEQTVSNIFSLVQNKQAIPTSHTDNPFQGREMLLTKVLSVKDEDVIYLTWILPNQIKNYEYKADIYLSYILGFEGRGSLTSYLEDEGLIQELQTDVNSLNDSFQTLEMQIFLTEKGFKNQQTVIAYVFKYLRIIKEQGVQKRIYDELADINRTSFHYKENKSCISSYASHLSKNLHFYPYHDILQAEQKFKEFNEGLIHSLLDQLVLQNTIIMVRSAEFLKESRKWKTEELYGTKYMMQPLSKNIINNCGNDENLIPTQTKKQLGVPQPNEYIPQLFEIKVAKTVQEFPKLILKDEFQDLWFLQDAEFKVCKGSIQMNIYPNQSFINNAEDRVMLELWQYIFGHYTREKEYEAEIAKLYFSNSITYNGLEIKIQGFNQHLPKFFLDMIQMLINLHSNPQQEIPLHVYEMKIEELQQRYENYYFKSPYDLTFSYWKQVIHTRGKYSKEDLEDALDQITYQKFIQFTKNLFNQVKIQWYISGNLTQDEAEYISLETLKLFQKISSPNLNIINLPIINIPQEQICVYERKIQDNPDEKNSGIFVYFQYSHSKDFKEELLLSLVSNFLSDPVENQLRTNEQLGYVVQFYKMIRRGVNGVVFCIISQEHGPNYLAKRIDEFLMNFRAMIDNYESEDFLKMKSALLEDLSQDYQNLQEKSDNHYKEIRLNTFQFNQKSQIKENLDLISLDVFKKCLKDVLYIQIRRLEIHVINPNHVKSDQVHKKSRKANSKLIFEKKFGDLEVLEDLFQYVQP